MTLKDRRKQRRSKGEGSIYRVSRQARGRLRPVWRAELQWTDAEGIAHRRSAQRQKESDARRVLDEWRRDIFSTGSTPTATEKTLTIGEVIYEYLADVKTSKRSSTARWHESIAQHHLRHLYSRRITALRRADVRAIAEDAGCSPRTRQAAYRLLQAALRQHQKRIAWDDLFPARKGPRVPKHAMRVWSAQEVQLFLATAQDERFYPLYRLALKTGARRGELLALRWRDIHPDQIEITGETKTERSRRPVSILRGDVTLSRGAPDDYLFPHPDDPTRTVHGSTVTHAFADLIKRLKMPRITFHGMRHTHASLLLKGGVHPKVVQERLGHSSIAVTLDVYSQVIPSMQGEAARTLSKMLNSQNSLTKPLTAPSAKKRNARRILK